MQKTSGFTLVELVVVITIVGILAAVAVPRYVALQRDARIAKTQAFYGAVKSAAVLAKARCELDLANGVVGGCTSTGGVVNMDGLNIDMVNRYPADTAAGIDAAAQMSASEGLTITGGGVTPPRVYEIVGASTASTCRIQYTAAAANAAPTITILTDGC